MDSKLDREINLEQRVVVLDTCSLQVRKCNFNSNFYDGWEGFKEITLDQVNDSKNLIKSMDEFVNSNKLVIIPEVLTEIKGYFEPLNEYIQNFKKYLSQKDSKGGDVLEALREYANLLYTFTKTIDHKDFRLSFDMEQPENYDELNELIEAEREITAGLLTTNNSRRFYEHFVMKRASWAKVVPQHFDGRFSVDFQDYHGFLKLALERSRDPRVFALGNADDFQKPGKFGILYDTDSKLIATTFALSDCYPVTLMSRDRGIEKTFHEITSILNGSSKLKIQNLRNPAYSPRIISPSMPRQASVQ